MLPRQAVTIRRTHALLLAGFLAALAIRIAFLVGFRGNYDVGAYGEVAASVRAGRGPYVEGLRYNYAPVWAWVVAGGSGQGEAIASNRVRGVRCALCWNVESARLSRSHNDANMLSLGERMLGEAEALAILDAWLDTPFEGGRHARRIAQLDAPE